MTSTNRVEVRLDSTLDSVDQAEEMTLKFASAAGFSEDDQMKIGMAVREAMVNAVYHGNKYDRAKKAGLTLQVESGNLIITITDQGSGFDLAAVPDPLAEENLLKHSGRGVFLMRSFMDEVQMRRLSPTGTEMRLTKSLSKMNGKEE